MILHLQEISVAVAPGAHAIVIVDQAGWHFSKALEIPDNITLLPLPAKWPELNPVETIWQFMRETGSQTEYLNPTTILLTIVASPGTNSSINRGELCQSGYATGRINDSF